jgi:hypothetical protein
MNQPSLPVVVIGAGPVGLAAAAHLLARGLTPRILESGTRVGSGMLRWAHVRMFSPWRFNIDRAARALLERHGWASPEAERFPRGGELVARYLEPLAAVPEIASQLTLGAQVVAITRLHRDRMKDGARGEQPFLVRYQDANGEHDLLARAVIDASGTVGTPNPLGASGIPVQGERALAGHIFYGMPDVLGLARERYAGRRVLVVGSGHSAFNVLADLAALRREAPATRILWALRRPGIARVLGGGEADQLAERGKLGMAIKRLVEDGTMEVAAGFQLDRLESTAEGIVAHGAGRALPAVDEVVACTGFRPDPGLLSELRVDLDAGTESPRALAPLIDPNLHSCGSVRPHGAEELKHPDAGFYIVGMKSYGRAPTFLLATGYEQVRSVVAAIAGDWAAARRVELELPETGVCITRFAAADDEAAANNEACCGGPPGAGVGACCLRDELAKKSGKEGCGCASKRGAQRVAATAPTGPQACCGSSPGMHDPEPRKRSGLRSLPQSLRPIVTGASAPTCTGRNSANGRDRGPS